MSQIEDRLNDMGLALPAPLVAPPGVRLPFAFVRVHGDVAHISGHGPFDGDRALFTGRVGAEVTVEQAYDAARATGLSMLASLKQELGDLDRVGEWIKALGFVRCADGFDATPGGDQRLQRPDPEALGRRRPPRALGDRRRPCCRSAFRSRSRRSSRSPDYAAASYARAARSTSASA